MELKSFDTILTGICDSFDNLVSPTTMLRSNTNIVYLMYKAISKGFELINNVCVALSNKFDPANCEEEDLESVSSLVGTEKIKGSASGVEIDFTNNTERNIILKKGTYTYKYNDDLSFTGTLLQDTTVESSDSFSFIFMSDSVGSYPVTEQSGITIESTNTIDEGLTITCLDNQYLLGRPDETNLEFRKRILTTTDRQNSLIELESAIKKLPYIFDCKLIFNQNEENIIVDSVTLAPFKMLIYVSGDIRNEIAELVAKYAFYETQADPRAEHYTVTYNNEVFANGSYSIQINKFRKVPFIVNIIYKLDKTFTSEKNVESILRSALRRKFTSQVHIDCVREADVYNVIEELNIEGLTVLSVNLTTIQGQPVDYITFPATSLPLLSTINFTVQE